MNIFKSAALVLLLASQAISAYAELELLEDEKLSDVKAQAGITIDIELELTIGEYAYKDAGSILVQGVRIGGNTNLADRTYAHNEQ